MSKMTPLPIAVTGMACWYPDARNPRQLWENILTRRRQFRLFPDQRLPLSDYYSTKSDEPDKTYGRKAAVIDGFEFDWAARRIPFSTFQTADVAHWLALEVALSALSDAGYDKQTVPKEGTGVIVGNSLTGEQTRTNAMRLRWPFVRRALRAAAQSRGLSMSRCAQIETALEQFYKSVFPPVNEDTLAGGLSNTIAGRICNLLDIHGGGYTVDGACSSSMLAVATGANGLVSGDLDLALVGGVDISLDTFELIGFAKTGALTPTDMRVYDRRGDGFIPGEGCGFILLKRLEDARRDKNYVYAVLQGWGISSDGKSTGITAPSAKGQAKALLRAYQKAPYTMDALKFIEGHGTGTSVGDKIELEAISMAMEASGKFQDNNIRPCGITSMKSIIGHTKAASGIAGFIKAVIAVNRRVLPPTANCKEPHPAFDSTAKRLFPVAFGEIFPAENRVKAGISAMGFGGINCHATIESADPPSHKLEPVYTEEVLTVSNQDTELIVLTSDTSTNLIKHVDQLLEFISRISYAELTDLAFKLAQEADSKAAFRAAVVAGGPESAETRLTQLKKMVQETELKKGKLAWDPPRNIWFANQPGGKRIAFLFPGQGSQKLNMSRMPATRFAWAKDLVQNGDKWLAEADCETVGNRMFRALDRASGPDVIEQWFHELSTTKYAQPAICLSSLVWHQFISRLGVKPIAMGGHSLGELTAFYAAGAYDEKELMQFAGFRGRVMSRTGEGQGAMVSLLCNRDAAEQLVNKIKGYLVLANINGPNQMVLSGETEAVNCAIKIAAKEGIQSRRLAVSNAFHSDLAASAARELDNYEPVNRLFEPVSCRLFSSTTGQELVPGFRLNTHFSNQVLSMVNFESMIKNMASVCDLFLEIGPGRVLTGLLSDILGLEGPICLPIESTPFQDADLNRLVAAVFIHGEDIQWNEFYAGRLIRPFIAPDEKLFIENPCERAFNVPQIPSTPAVNDAVEGYLSELVNVDPETWSEYLKARGGFLSKVIRADLESLAPDAVSPLEIERQEAVDITTSFSPKLLPETAGMSETEPGQVPEGVPEDLESIILSTVEKMTGFSRETLTMDMRLLDDLNLDSIKAGDFLSKVRKAAGVNQHIEPLELANARLSDISAVLKERQTVSEAAMISTVDVLALILKETSRVTGYPADTLDPDAVVEADLHMTTDMLKALLKTPAEHLGIDTHVDLEPLRHRSLRQIADIFARIARVESEKHQKPKDSLSVLAAVSGGATWVREFKVDMVEKPIAPLPDWGGKRQEDKWENQTSLIVATSEQSDLGVSIRDSLLRNGANAALVSYDTCIRENLIQDPSYSMVIAVLPMEDDTSEMTREGLQTVVTRLATLTQVPPAASAPRRRTTVAYVQFGGGFFGFHRRFASVNRCSATALAKSLHLERNDLRVRVIDFSPGLEAEVISEKVLNEIHTPQAFCAAGYDYDLVRREAQFQVLFPSQYRQRTIEWSKEDVMVVSGGAGGITAACAFALARKIGCRMALIGRTPHPDQSPEAGTHKTISKWLSKYRDQGLEARYYSGDVTKKADVLDIMKRIQTEMGPVSGIIHGAGLNSPRLVSQVSPEEVYGEIAPKVMGAVNLLEAVKDAPPKLIVGMSSVIGMTGMSGNAWYGFSNEALDLLLKRFETDHPKTQTQSVAYSVWDELGMGARMGSVEKLKEMGVDAIPAKEGVERFVRLVLQDAEAGRVIVVARLGGLDTWSVKEPSAPEKARYLETLEASTPKVESVFTCRLSLETDPYLKDHVFNGSYLLPTVFGLEAMAQAASHVCEQGKFSHVRIQDIRLDRPITVDPETGAEIIIWARLDEHNTRNGVYVVHAGVANRDDHGGKSSFSATVVFGLTESPKTERIEIPDIPLSIEPKQDLYRPNLLFQGPMFQQLATIWSLKNARDSAEEAVFDTNLFETDTAAQTAFPEPKHQHLFLGDPFFRDVLLQSAQMVVPQQTCLPVYIEKIDIFPKTDITTTVRCRTRLISMDGRQLETDVVAMDSSGKAVEKLSGYRLHILNHQPGNPKALDLIDPQDRDTQQVSELLERHCKSFGFAQPALALEYLENIHQKPVSLRHELELPIMRKACEKAGDRLGIQTGSFTIDWDSGNKPKVAGQTNEALCISLSHDDELCGCVAGLHAQGLDIAEVEHRTRQEWIDLLGDSFTDLLDELLDASETLDMAGTRIWSMKEAFIKAVGNVSGFFKIRQKSNDAVVFETSENGSLLTFSDRLTKGPQRIFAIVVYPEKRATPEISEDTGYEGYGELFNTQHFATVRGGPQGQGVFVHRIPVTFLPNKQLSRTVSFSNYLFWLGDIREASLWPVLEKVGKQFASGSYGLVTNRASLQILGEATAKDQIEIRMWVSGNSGPTDSTMDLSFDFRKQLSDGTYERLAWCEQAVTWVRILEHGVVKPEPYPDYYWNSMKDILPKNDAPNVPEPLPEPLKRLRTSQKDSDLYLAPSGPIVKPVLHEEIFDTSLEHSNLVGNIYFANYYAWQGQTRDRYFFSVVPEHFRGTGENGELLCLQTWIQHLREAMPFERIGVTMALKQLKPSLAVLYFEYFRVDPDGSRQKLAYGEQNAVWVSRNKDGRPHPSAFPQKVQQAFKRAISEK